MRLRSEKYREHKPRILRLSEFRDKHAGVENGPKARMNSRTRWLALNTRSMVPRVLCAPRNETRDGAEEEAVSRLK